MTMQVIQYRRGISWDGVTTAREGCGSQSVSVRYEYDKNGNATRILLPSGMEIRREYDDADRLVAETLYTYNMYGNSLERRAKVSGAGQGI